MPFRVYATKLLSHFTARFVPVSPPLDEDSSTAQDTSSPAECSADTSPAATSAAASDDDEAVVVQVLPPAESRAKGEGAE